MGTCPEQVESTDQNGDVSSTTISVNVHSVRYPDQDDELLVSDVKTNSPTQEEINLDNKK